MSQKATVLAMLRNAGERGVRSDEFIRSYMPRGCARVWELKASGLDIEATREGKYKRFVLRGGVGLGVGSSERESVGVHGPRPLPTPSVQSGQSRVGGRGERVPENRRAANGRDLDHHAANATPDPAARLFDLPSRSAFTDPEDVAA
jgi:hypothetical protein